jgi:putative tricarboxylic transport membrane protein
MIMLGDISTGFSLLFKWSVPLANMIGIIIGIVIGAIPGLGPTIAVAILIPVTFFLPTVPSMMLLLGVYQAGIYGGSISAILFNIPGVPASSATVFDGFPMAQQGKGGKALKIALFSSVFGNGFSCILLLLIAAPLAAVALRFGPPEIATLMLLALTVICAVSGRSILKGMLVGLLGLLLSTVGLDPIWGTFRLTWEIPELESGFSLIPFLIGLFAISELLVQSGRPDPALIIKKGKTFEQGLSQVSTENEVSFFEMWRMRGIMLWSALIGLFIGILPGIGSTTAAFMSYALARQRSKDPQMFGKGALEGIAAAETANNAVTGGALIPMLSLGIPGDAVTAVILGAFILQGLAPGPFLFKNHGPEVYAILFGLILSTIPTLILGFIFLHFAVRVLKLRRSLIFPVILVMCVVGSFSVDNSLFDVAVMFGFGFLGYAFRLGHYPLPPLLIGFILGKPFEEAMRQSLLISKGSLMVFLESPISTGFLILSVIVLIFSLRISRRIRMGI